MLLGWVSSKIDAFPVNYEENHVLEAIVVQIVYAIWGFLFTCGWINLLFGWIDVLSCMLVDFKHHLINAVLEGLTCDHLLI